jgi:hypothetical protein
MVGLAKHSPVLERVRPGKLAMDKREIEREIEREASPVGLAQQALAGPG